VEMWTELNVERDNESKAVVSTTVNLRRRFVGSQESKR